MHQRPSVAVREAARPILRIKLEATQEGIRRFAERIVRRIVEESLRDALAREPKTAA